MIGRTLDAILDIIGYIGLAKGGSDSLVHGVASELRRNILPVEKLCYSKYEEDGELKDIVAQSLGWSDYSDEEGIVKRRLAKAFEMRRKVKVGGKFTLNDPIKRRLFYMPRDYSIERLSKNTVIVHHKNSYLVSSSKKELLEHRKSGFIPVHYNWVIF